MSDNLKVFRRDAGNDPYAGIEMRDRVRCSLTGFSGVVIGRAEHLTGCNQAYVLPASEKANEIKDGHWIDVERLEIVAKAAVDVESRPGGADIPPPYSGGRRA